MIKLIPAKIDDKHTFFIALTLCGFVLLSALYALPSKALKHAQYTLSYQGKITTLNLLVADNFRKRYHGLSNHHDLPNAHGMILTYDHPKTAKITTEKMQFNLDIAFIDESGKISKSQQIKHQAH